MASIMKHQAAIALLVAILSNFSNCDYCPVSVPTVSVVSKCPTTKAEWDEAASRKKCSHMTAKCGTKSPVYHCLLNQWGNETVEVCASDWFISGFCAIYNTDEMKVIDDFNRDCTNFTSGYCPTRYISTDAYMYQGCYEKRNTSTPLPSTDKQCFRVHVSTDCTLPAAIIAIIIVLSLLSLILSLLLVLTCRGKISKSVRYRQCMRLCKQTPDEEQEMEGSSTDEKSSETESLLQDVKKSVSLRTDKREEEKYTMPVKEIIKQIEPKSVSPRTDKTEEENDTMPVKEKIKQFDQKSVSLRTGKTEEENNTMPVKEIIKLIETDNKVKETDKKDEDKRRKSGQNLKTSSDASDSTTDTSKKDENLINEEMEPTSFGRINSPKDDRKSECNVKDPSYTMEDLNTKNEDLNVESVEEENMIVDGRTDSPDGDRKLESIDKVELEDDRLHENDSKVMEMRSYEISADEKERDSENKYESQKDIELSSSTSNENKNSTEKEEQLDLKEKPPQVKSRVKEIQERLTKHN